MQRVQPLEGVRFIELGGIGPVPHAGLILAQMGATGVRIGKPGPALLGGDAQRDPLLRGRPTVEKDLRDPAAIAEVLELVGESDILVEGFRPGVAERMGLGPEHCHAVNPALVYGRMTGWGQDGPMAQRAGHDINYSALAGPLRHTARDGERPVPALNLIADHGGGSMYLVAGVLAGVIRAKISGQGSVVDAAMVDGAAHLMSLVHGLRAQGAWPNPPGRNSLDTGAPFYDVYACADGKYLSVGCLEPHFYAQFIEGLGLAGEDLPHQFDFSRWEELRARFTETIAGRPRDEWAAIFADTDACVAPILDMQEAAEHPHLKARGTFEAFGEFQVPAAAPRIYG